MSSVNSRYAPRGGVIQSALIPRVFTIGNNVVLNTYKNGMLGVSNITFDDINTSTIGQKSVASVRQGGQSNITALSPLYYNIISKLIYGNPNTIINPSVKVNGVAQQVQLSTYDLNSIVSEVSNGTSFYSDGYSTTYVLTQPVIIEFTNSNNGLIETLEILNYLPCCETVPIPGDTTDIVPGVNGFTVTTDASNNVTEVTIDGKLNVSGGIDPTYIQLVPSNGKPSDVPISASGVVWVNNHTGTNKLYLDNTQVGAGSAGNQDLISVLEVGNTTGGNNIDFGNTDSIIGCSNAEITNIETTSISAIGTVGTEVINIGSSLSIAPDKKIEGVNNIVLNVPLGNETKIMVADADVLNIKGNEIVAHQPIVGDLSGNAATATTVKDVSNIVLPIFNDYGLPIVNYGTEWKSYTSITDKNWVSISISDDGIYQSAVVRFGYIYVSSDSGQTWKPKLTDTVRNWSSIAISGNGSFQSAVASQDYLYFSTDYGNTWNIYTNISDIGDFKTEQSYTCIAMSQNGNFRTVTADCGNLQISSDGGATWAIKDDVREWTSVSMSDDGQFQVAVVYNGFIYLSTDYGVTWVPKTIEIDFWQGVAISNNGQYITAVSNKYEYDTGYIYVSSDGGDTWAAKSISTSWKSVSMSTDGSIQTAVVTNGQIYVSTDFGNTWVPKTTDILSWSCVSLSSDGLIQAAVSNNIYESTDSGDNWIPISNNTQWRGISLSVTGQFQTAIIYNEHIYISNDYGANWIAKDSIRDWISVSISATGQFQTAVVSNGQIYVSNDYGNTWAAKSINTSWSSVSVSATGQYQTAVVDGGLIYVSNNYGQTWNPNTTLGSKTFRSISISATGQFQTTVDYDGQIYISNDYGNTWPAKSISTTWISVSVSATGQFQTAVISGGQIYVSSDYGQTWVAKDDSREWISVSISATGQFQTAIVSNGQIYVSNDYGNTWVANEQDKAWISVSVSSNGLYQSAVVDGGDIFISQSGLSASTFVGNLLGNASTANTATTSNTIIIHSCFDGTMGIYPDRTFYPIFVPTIVDNSSLDVYNDNALSYVPLTGTLTATTFSGNVTGDVIGDLSGNVTGNVTGNLFGNATSSTNTTNINITSTIINYPYYPTFVSDISGNQPEYVNSNFKYNPSTNTLEVNTVTPSDRNLKENIIQDVLGLDFINKLNPVSYNLISSPDKRHIGIIAQEVEEVTQSLNYTSFGAIHPPTGENSYYSVNYSEFIPSLIQSIKELSQENESLKNRIAALETKI